MAIVCLQWKLLNITIYCNYSSLKNGKLSKIYIASSCLNQERNMQIKHKQKQFNTVIEKNRCERTTADWLFHRKKHYYELCNHIMARSDGFDEFVSYKHTDFLNINRWTVWCGLLVDYCIHWWAKEVMQNFYKIIYILKCSFFGELFL